MPSQEDTPVADCSVLCLLHLPDQQCIVSGCEDGSIKLNYLEGHAASAAGDAVQLPTVLTGHEGKVTGLAALPGGLVLSCSEDRSLRVWDLRTMKQLHVSVPRCGRVQILCSLAGAFGEQLLCWPLYTKLE
jgi:WD40 repeat protein